ncbi:MAG: SDR family oxidoreductase, partial [Armatimonadetes bacterium]|nr:SDR family oxidoreductase [Anaerolineae bacterium]
MMEATYLVTGSMGCVGAWVLHHLVKQGKRAISFDLSTDRARLNALLTPDEQHAITFINGEAGDLTQFERVKLAFEQHNITHVVHLAALQVPFCRANPVLGAQVNVTGTVNVFEAAKQSDVRHLALASSVAVYGAATAYPPGLLAHDAPMLPATLYGVYKVANEGTARIYWQDHSLSSTTLRPYTVYGVGRDLGMTSEPTKAMVAAAHGLDYHITFGGHMQFHFASDVALQFIAAAEQAHDGALAFNLGTPPVDVIDVAALIIAAAPGVKITVGDGRLPFPAGCDPSAFYAHAQTIYETPLADGVRQTI